MPPNTMKQYLIEFFTHSGCTLQHHDEMLSVELTPELAQHFGKSTLQLVFDPAHLKEQTELVTYGSYIIHRIYDLLRHTGERIAFTLPNTQKAGSGRQKADMRKQGDIRPYLCAVTTRRSRDVRRTETFLTFRVTYYSNEKFEELVTIGIDVDGNLKNYLTFPYSLASLHNVSPHKLPYTKRETKAIYNRCLAEARTYAEQQAQERQQALAEHYHQDIIRLEGYYQQMIEEISDLAEDRESQIVQFQQEFERKAAEELKRCQIHVQIEPINFCSVTIPFRRYQYLLTPFQNRGIPPDVSLDTYQNLFSGQWLYPTCSSCGREMTDVGICSAGNHAACRDCLFTCHVCGTSVCRECGIEKCAECHEWVCQECSERCHLCGKRFCTEHLVGCRECRQHVCPQCSDQCEECGTTVGSIHLMQCDVSHKRVCPHCLITCPCCGQHVAQSQTAACAFCGQQVCADCTFSCDVCGGTFCIHHIIECEISGKTICLRHSATCESCSKRVSAAYLHTCEVCRKTICSDCAAQCHGCGIFFCETHADEMEICPGCGNAYCALCYSGQGLCRDCRAEAAAVVSE